MLLTTSVALQEALGPRTAVFLSDVETDAWPPGLVNELASRSARWLITRGEFGADEVANNASTHLPPEKASCHLRWDPSYKRAITPNAWS
jgi:hypothetical protein